VPEARQHLSVAHRLQSQRHKPKRYSGCCINNSRYPQVVGAYFGDLVRVTSGAAVVGESGHIFARRAHDATVGDDWR
jgi:hypothetical protein